MRSAEADEATRARKALTGYAKNVEARREAAALDVKPVLDDRQ
jgi:hypothetical protein